MPPNATTEVQCTGVLNENDAETADGGLDKNIEELKHAHDRKIHFVWRNIIAFVYVHLAAVYGAWLLLTSAKLYTIAFGKWNHNHNIKTNMMHNTGCFFRKHTHVYMRDI